MFGCNVTVSAISITQSSPGSSPLQIQSKVQAHILCREQVKFPRGILSLHHTLDYYLCSLCTTSGVAWKLALDIQGILAVNAGL